MRSRHVENPATAALESVRNLWNGSIAIIIVWFLFLPGAIDRLAAYDAALHMTAWRLLTDLTRTLPHSLSGRYLKVGYVVNNPQTGFVGRAPPHSSYPLFGMECYRLKAEAAIDQPETEQCYPLVINATWPDQRQIIVFLSSELLSASDGFDGSRWQPNQGPMLVHFKIRTRSGKLPIGSYIVTYDGDEYRVHNINDPWTKAVLAEWPGHKTMPISRPLHWRDDVAYAHDEDADATTVTLQKFQQAADLSGGTLSIAGMNLNVGFAFAGIGIVLASVAFLMIGPLTILQESPPPENSVWTLAIKTLNRPRLEVTIHSIWIIWAVAPVGILGSQLFVGAALPWPYQVLKVMGVLGLSFTAWIFGRCLLIVRALRKVA